MQVDVGFAELLAKSSRYDISEYARTLLAEPDVVKVGPKGYIHGWIFVGAPGVGDHVFHPRHGEGTVKRVDEHGHVHVAFGGGKTKRFEHQPGAGKGRLAARSEVGNDEFTTHLNAARAANRRKDHTAAAGHYRQASEAATHPKIKQEMAERAERDATRAGTPEAAPHPVESPYADEIARYRANNQRKIEQSQRDLANSDEAWRPIHENRIANLRERNRNAEQIIAERHREKKPRKPKTDTTPAPVTGVTPEEHEAESQRHRDLAAALERNDLPAGAGPSRAVRGEATRARLRSSRASEAAFHRREAAAHQHAANQIRDRAKTEQDQARAQHAADDALRAGDRGAAVAHLTGPPSDDDVSKPPKDGSAPLPDGVTVAEHSSGRLHVKSPYDKAFIQQVKNLGGHWLPASKSWSVSAHKADALDALIRKTYGGKPNVDAASLPRAASISTRANGKIEVRAPLNESFRRHAHTLGGAWDPSTKSWVFPPHRESQVRETVAKDFGPEWQKMTADAAKAKSDAKKTQREATASGSRYTVSASDRQKALIRKFVTPHSFSWHDFFDGAGGPDGQYQRGGPSEMQLREWLNDLTSGEASELIDNLIVDARGW